MSKPDCHRLPRTDLAGGRRNGPCNDRQGPVHRRGRQTGAAYFGRVYVMSQLPNLDWFAAAEARGMALDDPIFTIGVVRDLPSLDLT